MSDHDRLDRALEKRADLLNWTTGMLVHAMAEGRAFTEREQDAWDWAMGEIDRLGELISAVTGILKARGYKLVDRRLPWLT